LADVLAVGARGADPSYPDGPSVATLADCARDEAALAVALAPRGARILTLLGPDRAPPALCGRLAEWGLVAHSVESRPSAHLERERLLPALARAGVAELAWAGLELAVVHVVAPRAAAIPTFGPPAPTLGLDDDPTSLNDDDDPTDCWGDARAFWYPLTLD
jgi:hypothetical protein